VYIGAARLKELCTPKYAYYVDQSAELNTCLNVRVKVCAPTHSMRDLKVKATNVIVL